jgi:hypothetical protein
MVSTYRADVIVPFVLESDRGVQYHPDCDWVARSRADDYARDYTRFTVDLKWQRRDLLGWFHFYAPV